MSEVPDEVVEAGLLEIAETIGAWEECEHLSYEGTDDPILWECAGCGHMARRIDHDSGEIEMVEVSPRTALRCAENLAASGAIVWREEYRDALQMAAEESSEVVGEARAALDEALGWIQALARRSSAPSAMTRKGARDFLASRLSTEGDA